MSTRKFHCFMTDNPDSVELIEDYSAYWAAGQYCENEFLASAGEYDIDEPHDVTILSEDKKEKWEYSVEGEYEPSFTVYEKEQSNDRPQTD